MNEYTRTRLLRIRDILARHVNAIDMALDFQATEEVEAEAYRLADEEGLIYE